MNDKNIFELLRIAKRCYWMYEDAIANNDHRAVALLRYCLEGSAFGPKSQTSAVMEPVSSVTNLTRVFHAQALHEKAKGNV